MGNTAVSTLVMLWMLIKRHLSDTAASRMSLIEVALPHNAVCAHPTSSGTDTLLRGREGGGRVKTSDATILRWGD